MSLKIFSPKNRRKNGALGSKQSYVNYAKLDHKIGFRKKRQFSAKIAVNCYHDIDPLQNSTKRSGLNAELPLSNEPVSGEGLPDFFGTTNIPNDHKICKIAVKIPNRQKICFSFQGLPKIYLDFRYVNIPSGNCKLFK
jgi:hypothetical protein